MKLRFHWMLPKGGEVRVGGGQAPKAAARYRAEAACATSPAALTDMEGWSFFARQAEDAGIDSVLVALNRYEPDPLLISCALGQVAKKLKFIAAYRSGLVRPTSFVQQVNTLSALVEGRIALNIVAGSSSEEQHSYGDFLSHDERYERAEEFLAICNAFWRNEAAVNFAGQHYQIEEGKLHTPFLSSERSAPEIYISGHSEPAERLARREGTCLLRVADDPEKLRAPVARLREDGIEVCLRMCVLCRPTREEALEVAMSLLPEGDTSAAQRSMAAKDDSQMYREAAASGDQKDVWPTRSLWRGLVPYHGPVWTTLLGSPAEVAAALLEYKEIGVTQFIMSGWPETDEVAGFGRDVLPLVRQAEQL
jgi:alkanesulfonate monooxygenase